MTFQLFLSEVHWGTVGWVLVGTVVALVVVAAIGRGIAAAFPPKPEHMSSFRKPAAPIAATPAPAAPATVRAASAPVAPAEISPEIMAVIAASVAVVLHGKSYSIKGVAPAASAHADVERLMSLWSLEGRRQVYSSHTMR